jgi:vacuolar-type H+-ATPase catalytic subunit A/Vma1
MKKTNEQLFITLGEEFSDKVIESNIKLIEAIAKEEFELAANIRDLIQDYIKHAVILSQDYLTLTEEQLKEHYQQQNDYVFTNLNKAYNENK